MTTKAAALAGCARPPRARLLQYVAALGRRLTVPNFSSYIHLSLPSIFLHLSDPPHPSTALTPCLLSHPCPPKSRQSTLITNRNQLVASLRHRDLHIFDIQIRVEENQYWQTEDGTHCQPINARSLLQRRGGRGRWGHKLPQKLERGRRGE